MTDEPETPPESIVNRFEMTIVAEAEVIKATPQQPKEEIEA